MREGAWAGAEASATSQTRQTKKLVFETLTELKPNKDILALLSSDQYPTVEAVESREALRWALDSAEAARLEPVSDWVFHLELVSA